MEWALQEIKKIQHAARNGKAIIKPRWPMLVLRTPKGLSGPKIVHGEIVEGSFHSHQVPLPLAKTSDDELELLQDWLSSYKPQELFTKEGVPVDTVLSVIPDVNSKKLGQRKESYDAYTPLLTPDWKEICVKKGSEESCMKAVGRFLKEVVKEYVQLFVWFLFSKSRPLSKEPYLFPYFLS
jgi:xylulose-5-phosphate/fructose-6-phosphate phosphoketolase